MNLDKWYIKSKKSSTLNRMVIVSIMIFEYFSLYIRKCLILNFCLVISLQDEICHVWDYHHSNQHARISQNWCHICLNLALYFQTLKPSSGKSLQQKILLFRFYDQCSVSPLSFAIKISRVPARKRTPTGIAYKFIL